MDWPALITAVTASGVALGTGVTFVVQQMRSMSKRIQALEVENRLLRAEVSAVVRGSGLSLSVWVKGVDRRIRWVSPRAMRIIFAPLGLEEDGVLGRTFRELFGDEVGQTIEDLDRRAMSELDSTQVDIVQLDQRLTPMVIIKTVTEDDDGKIVFQGIAIRLSDMAERRGGENAMVLSRLVAADRQNRRAGARDELGLHAEQLTSAEKFGAADDERQP